MYSLYLHAGHQQQQQLHPFHTSVAAPDEPPELVSESSESSDMEEHGIVVGSDQEEETSEGAGGMVSEADVLQIMEVTSLHRGQPIDLLLTHDGDPHLVLEAVFG